MIRVSCPHCDREVRADDANQRRAIFAYLVKELDFEEEDTGQKHVVVN